MEKLLHWFWSAIDISDNIARALRAIRALNRLSGIVMFCALGVMEYGLYQLVMYLDIGATAEWASVAAKTLAPALSPEYTLGIGAATAVLTMMPSLSELFASRFAREGIVFAGGLVFSMSLFDVITDWPRVVEFCEPYRTQFGSGYVGIVMFEAFRGAWLFMASFGFEALFIIFGVCLVALVPLVVFGHGQTITTGARNVH